MAAASSRSLTRADALLGLELRGAHPSVLLSGRAGAVIIAEAIALPAYLREVHSRKVAAFPPVGHSQSCSRTVHLRS